MSDGTNPERPRRGGRVVLLDEAEAGPSPQDTPGPGEAGGASEAGIDPTADALAPGPSGSPRPFLGRWARLFLAAGAALGGLGLALSLDRLIRALWEASPWIAWPAMAVTGLFVLAGVVLIGRELAAIGRIRRVGALRARAEAARSAEDLRAASAVCVELRALYAGAPLDGAADLGAQDWRRLADRARDVMDAGGRLDLYERAVLGPRDAAARAAIRQASRRVATATAILPSALLDGVAALVFNLRMIRQLAEIYGGRAGFFGSLGLARRVVEHAMAIGLIALTDDLLEPLMGGGVASKLSRRLGEGVVNGALTARLGLAALALCRPLPFAALEKPTLRELAWEAVSRR